MLTVNLRSAYLCCRAALPRCAPPRAIVTSRPRVVPPAGGFLAYTVAKAGVIALTQALAQEVGARNHRERRPAQHDGHRGEPTRHANHQTGAAG